jgi:hypothetical protein
MVGMACVGLALALFTTSARRAHDTGRAGSPSPPPASPPQAPLPEYQVIAAIEVGKARQRPAGRELIEQLVPGRGGLPGLGEGSGLTLDNLDHVVVGLRLNEDRPDRPLRGLTVVAHTRTPIDLTALRVRLQAGPPIERAGKTIYPLNLLLPGLLRCDDDRTVAIALRLDGTKPEADLDRVALSPSPAQDNLAADLQPFLREAEARGAVAWTAGQAEKGETLARGLPRGVLKPADREALAGVRVFAAALELDEAVTLRATFRCRDSAAATAFRSLLDRWGAKGPDAVVQEKDAWVTLRLRTTPQALAKARGQIVRGVLGLSER